MERDDLIVNDSYSKNATHSEEAGAKIRKNIWKVTAILTALTVLEVMMGIYFKRSETFTWTAIKWSFIVLTLVKAGYIVMVFMHLGDERKNLRRIILVPYAIFIGYLIFIGLTEGLSHFELWELFK
jgi:cytochrome c oxidase subunit IV